MIAQVDVTDPDNYSIYANAISATLEPYGGRFLVRAGHSIQVEGKMRERLVVIEFQDYKTALGFYRSADYQTIIPLRTAGAAADIVIVEGIESDLP